MVVRRALPSPVAVSAAAERSRHVREVDSDDDSPSNAMTPYHACPRLVNVVPHVTILVDFLATYMNPTRTCVLSGDKFERVADIHVAISEKTGIATKAIECSFTGTTSRSIPYNPLHTLEEAGFKKITRIVMRTWPNMKPEGPAEEAGASSDE